MLIQVWYTKQYDGYEGAEDVSFERLADAWNYFNQLKAEHPEDRNLMLTVDHSQIA